MKNNGRFMFYQTLRLLVIEREADLPLLDALALLLFDRRSAEEVGVGLELAREGQGGLQGGVVNPAQQ